jgi:hypothetical protein
MIAISACKSRIPAGTKPVTRGGQHAPANVADDLVFNIGTAGNITNIRLVTGAEDG